MSKEKYHAVRDSEPKESGENRTLWLACQFKAPQQRQPQTTAALSEASPRHFDASVEATK